MARNNGPAPPPRRWPEPSQAQPSPHVPQPQHGQHQAAGYNPQAYPPTPAGPGYGAADGYPPAAPGQAYHYPDQGVGDPGHYDQGYQGDAYSQATLNVPQQGFAPRYEPQHVASHAPQFEPYAPRTQPPAPPLPDAHGHADPAGYRQRDPRIVPAEPVYRPPAAAQGYPAQAPTGYAQPHTGPAGYYGPQDHAEPAYGQWEQRQSEPQLRGSTYDQNPNWQAQGADPYAAAPGWPPQQPHQHLQQHDGYGAPQDAFGQPQQGYPDAHGYGAPAYGEQAYTEPGYGEQHYAPDQGFGPADGYAAPAVQQAQEGEYDAEEFEYEDEPKGRGKLVKAAAALVVAIGIGGGMAWAYKAYIAGPSSGKPPVVRPASAPAKVKPDDPGGKQFAHTDSKILGRLSDQGSKPAAAATEADGAEGTRKVSTMVVGRDGSIVASPAPSAPPPAQAPQAASPVPGMTIVDGFGGRPPASLATPPTAAAAPTIARTAAVAPPVAAPAAPVAPAPPAKPVVITRAEPVEAAPPVAPAKAEAPKPAPKPKPSRTAAVAASDAAPAPAAAVSSGAGYVAVLSSIPSSASSNMESLKRFADLQQKYAGQLGGKTPEVQSANLGAKGNYDRLVVGPPGSRQQANQLCSDLKTAGYAGCWVKSY